jgi:hypothetical protein
MLVLLLLTGSNTACVMYYWDVIPWQVSKWRLAYKEAEAQLVELKGITVSDTPTSGSGNKQLVWTAEDQTRFTRLVILLSHYHAMRC